MYVCRRSRRRRGAALVEFAVVGPLLLFLFFAQFVGGMGISRYQEVAHLAREGARYAAVHGGTYQDEGIATQTGVAQVASSSDLSTYLARRTVLLDPSRTQVTVTWTAPSSYSPRNMPYYVDTNPNLVPPGQNIIFNNVIVTVQYQWFPEMYLVGPILLTSTSEMPMSY